MGVSEDESDLRQDKPCADEVWVVAVDQDGDGGDLAAADEFRTTLRALPSLVTGGTSEEAGLHRTCSTLTIPAPRSKTSGRSWSKALLGMSRRPRAVSVISSR